MVVPFFQISFNIFFHMSTQYCCLLYDYHDHYFLEGEGSSLIFYGKGVTLSHNNKRIKLQ